MSADQLVDDWADAYLDELADRHDRDVEGMLEEACEQAMSYKWALTWISSHSSEVANLQVYAQMALGTWEFQAETETNLFQAETD